MTERPLKGPDSLRAIEDACKDDEISKLPKHIGMATLADPIGMQTWLRPCLRRSAKTNSPEVMRHLIEQGADVKNLMGGSIVDTENDTLPSLEILELLIEHGWDINSRGARPSGTPLLWYVVDDPDLVKWCLDHGAELDPADDTPPDAIKPRVPILECAAVDGNIESFEILRAAGAPVSYDHGLLPSTVMSACYYAWQPARFKRSIAMVRHLVDVVGCDANSISYGAYYGSGSLCSTPLCWIACHTRDDTRELIEFLLDRGGDLDLAGPTFDGGVVVPSARTAAKERPNEYFLEVVAEWEAKHLGTASDEV